MSQERLVFVITDGVGQSFFGNLAAAMLGERLADWAAAIELTIGPEGLSEQLRQFLAGAVHEVDQRVRQFQLATDLSELERSAFEQKREYGSETMFGLVAAAAVGPTVDAEIRAICASLGDVVVGVASPGQPPIELRGDAASRWSSREGCRGNLLVESVAGKDATRMYAFSDGCPDLGLASADPSGPDIQRAIAQSLAQPTSDDVSFVEVVAKNRPSVLDGIEKAEVRPMPNGHRGSALAWTPVDSATHYLVQTSSGGEHLVRTPYWRVADAGSPVVIVRAMEARLSAPLQIDGPHLSPRQGASDEVPSDERPPPSQPGADPAITRAVSADRRPQSLRQAEYIALAAAVLVIVGFALGWLLRSALAFGQPEPASTSAPILWPSPATSPSAAPSPMPTYGLVQPSLPPNPSPLPRSVSPTASQNGTATQATQVAGS